MFVNQIWAELHPLEQREYAEFLSSALYKEIITREIKTCHDQLSALDTNLPREDLATKYLLHRARLDFWREMLLFVTNLKVKPLDPE